MIQQESLLEPSLNSPHDTKHGNMTTCITVYIHRMILDMIQGCRYLQKLTGQWLLSKNSMTRLKGGWHGAGLLWNCLIPITNTKGSYLYPGSNTTPSRPRLQHLLPKINVMASCLSRTRHQFIPSLYSSHVITHSRMLPLSSVKQLFCRMMTYPRPQTPLLNALRKTFCRMVLFYQTRPTGQSLPERIEAMWPRGGVNRPAHRI
jgi:hypothetical protein